jgi:hypothetical protein
MVGIHSNMLQELILSLPSHPLSFDVAADKIAGEGRNKFKFCLRSLSPSYTLLDFLNLLSMVTSIPLKASIATTKSSGYESDSSNAYSETEPSTAALDDNYVRNVLAKERPLPPITLKNWYKEINVISTLALTLVPMMAFYGAATVEVNTKTVIWSIIYYYFSGLGITAGTLLLNVVFFGDFF